VGRGHWEEWKEDTGRKEPERKYQVSSSKFQVPSLRQPWPIAGAWHLVLVTSHFQHGAMTPRSFGAWSLNLRPCRPWYSVVVLGTWTLLLGTSPLVPTASSSSLASS
jgi:hypothetical protein